MKLLARIARTAPGRLLVELCVLIAAAVLLGLAVGSLLPAPARPLVGTLLGVPLVIGVYVLLVHKLERRPVTELGTDGALLELGAGLLLGATLFATVIGIIALFGGYVVRGVAGPWALVPPLAMAAASAVTEEVIARGVVFRLLEQWLGTWAALGISAALFGAAHLGNPHASVTSALAIAAEAGILLATAYMLTRRLWLAIGLHASWNYVQAAVFGVAVSGTEVHGLLVGELRGPDWLSGGAFGAEASVVAVGLGLGVAMVLLMKRKRGEST